MKTLRAICCALIFAAAPLFAENEFYFRVMPAFNVPVGEENLSGGFGAAASFDWRFWDLPKKTGLGLSLLGGYSNYPVADESTLSAFEGGLGPFFVWRVLDRLSLRADAAIGVYNYSWDEGGGTRLHFGGAVSGYFHILPYLAVFAEGGYNWYAFAETPLSAIRAAVGVSLNLGELLTAPSRVRAEKTEQRQIFPVSYAWYEKNEIATVKITNNEPNAVTDVQASFFLERYMNQPFTFALVPRLAPGETVELPVTALFNESMLGLMENATANTQVLVDYRSLGARRQGGFSLQMPVFHRNAMSWDDDRRAASFVSARDPAAVYFAKYVHSAVRRNLRPDVPEKVQLAAALFEALNAYGLNYVIDPSSSYIEMSENASALDSLNYPYQTLMFRGGDCDDISILFCSLLEVLGIETAFVTIPGHIYMAFKPGEADDGWKQANAEKLIERDGSLWLPVEITIPQEGFTEAWRVGLREWNNAGDGGKLYPMRDSWSLYQPVSVPGAGESLPAMPDEADILKRFNATMSK